MPATKKRRPSFSNSDRGYATSSVARETHNMSA
jgi:hypothetical protein